MGLARVKFGLIGLAIPLRALLARCLVPLDQLLHDEEVLYAWRLLASLSQHASVSKRLLGQLFLLLLALSLIMDAVQVALRRFLPHQLGLAMKRLVGHFGSLAT